MRPFHQPPVVRLEIGAPGGEPARQHRREPHPPSVVAQVRHFIETTRLTYRQIGARTGAHAATLSVWVRKHGWKRPAGCYWSTRHKPETLYVRVASGRELATRLRRQAERLVAEMESAQRVDPAALAEALKLLAEAREAHQTRRERRLVPPPPSEVELAAKAEAARTAKEAKAESDRILREHGRGRLSSARREGAIRGWSRRYARLRDAGLTSKEEK